MIADWVSRVLGSSVTSVHFESSQGWTFARRDGRDYFLKRFLSPTYPDDEALGSPHTK